MQDESKYPDWLMPRWWADGHDAAISRTRLIDKWVVAAPSPKPEKKVFVPELSAWSSALGIRPWVKDLFGATAAGLAHHQSVKAETGDAEGWWQVSLLYMRYGDPLSRYSGGFRDEAKSRRPTGLPKRVSIAVREFERNDACVAARGELLGARTGMSVITTQADADRFLAGPWASHDEVLSAAMRSYAGALITYCDRLALTSADMPPDVDVQIALNDCIAALAEFGEPTGVRREATEQEKARATALLTQLLTDRPELLEQHTDVLGEAWASTHTTLTNWMIDGLEITDALILFKRVKAVRTDHLRAQIRYEKRIRSDESLTTGLDEHGATPAWGGDSDTDNFDRVELRNLLGQMRTALGEYPAAVIANDVPIDCWEKQYARAILDHGATVADRVDFTHLRPLVMQVWREGKPATARSNTAAQAAKDIESMLRIAFSAVVEQADDLSLVGTRKRTETWRARTAEVNSLLQKCRDDAGMEKK